MRDRLAHRERPGRELGSREADDCRNQYVPLPSQYALDNEAWRNEKNVALQEGRLYVFDMIDESDPRNADTRRAARQACLSYFEKVNAALVDRRSTPWFKQLCEQYSSHEFAVPTSDAQSALEDADDVAVTRMEISDDQYGEENPVDINAPEPVQTDNPAEGSDEWLRQQREAEAASEFM